MSEDVATVSVIAGAGGGGWGPIRSTVSTGVPWDAPVLVVTEEGPGASGAGRPIHNTAPFGAPAWGVPLSTPPEDHARRLEDEVERLTDENRALRAERDSANRWLSEYRQQIVALTAAAEALGEKVDDPTEYVGRLVADRDALRSEVASLTAGLPSCEDYAALLCELKALRDRVGELSRHRSAPETVTREGPASQRPFLGTWPGASGSWLTGR